MCSKTGEEIWEEFKTALKSLQKHVGEGGELNS